MNKENIQCLVNIASNCVEICNTMGCNALLGAAIVAINRYHVQTRILVSVGLASIAAGAAVPALMQYCAKTNEIAAAAIGLVVSSVLAFGLVWCFFLPMKIAKYRNHAHRKAIIVLNLLLLVPFSWCVALWWATKPDKKLIANTAENFSPAVLAICERTDSAVKMLEEAGFKKASEKIRFALIKDVAGEELLIRLDGVLGRLMFDFELPDAIADEIRSLSEEIYAAQRT